MERYKASIESVDSALNRLNQTLASYKLLASTSPAANGHSPEESPVSREAEPVAPSPNPNGSQNAVPDPASSVAAATTARLPSQRVPPEQGIVERLMLGLRAGYQYPEVCT